MKATILSIVMLFSSWAFALGQTFSVTGSNPNDGTANIALTTTVSLSFSESVNTTDSIDWEEYIIYEPYDSLFVSNIHFSNDQKTVHFDVEQAAQTDFIWMVLDVPSSGGSLSNGYTFTYTTAASLGAYQLSGNISSSNSSQSKQQLTATPTLSIEDKNLERLLVKAATSNQAINKWNRAQSFPSKDMVNSKIRKNKTSTSREDHFTMTFAMLLDNNYFSSSDTTTEGTITAAALVDASIGSYTIDHVRSGTHWPIVVKYDFSKTTLLPFEIGFYDANQDQKPDSVVIQNGDAAGIDMTLQSVDAFTAREGLSRANDFADTELSEHRLLLIEGYEVGYDQILFGSSTNETSEQVNNGLTGNSYFWTYFYHEPSTDSVLTVALMAADISYTFKLHADDMSFLGDFDSLKTIPAGFIDSDQAIQVAEANGGSDFRGTLTAEDFLMVQMSGGHDYHSFSPDSTPSAPVFWDIFYFGITTDTASGWPTYHWMSVKVDMESGQVLNVTSTNIEEKAVDLPSNVSLGQNYPNPFNPTTSIPFELSTAGNVKITIYNLLGQPVALLTDRPYSAGTHQISWDASTLSSGIYLYHLEVGNHIQTKKLMLLK